MHQNIKASLSIRIAQSSALRNRPEEVAKRARIAARAAEIEGQAKAQAERQQRSERVLAAMRAATIATLTPRERALRERQMIR